MTDIVKEALKKWAKEVFIGEMVTKSGGILNGEGDEFLNLAIESIQNTRVMYDFYDKYELSLQINVNMFYPSIKIGSNNDFWVGEKQNSRTEAEKAGFEKCAELLNEKLKG